MLKTPFPRESSEIDYYLDMIHHAFGSPFFSVTLILNDNIILVTENHLRGTANLLSVTSMIFSIVIQILFGLFKTIAIKRLFFNWLKDIRTIPINSDSIQTFSSP
jgi:hypothetical protein